MNREEQLSAIFAKMAANIAGRYAIDIQATTAIKGSRPPFEELMDTLKLLDKDLTAQAVKLLEAYKNETGTLPDTLTAGMKQIIGDTVASFVKQL